MGQRATLIVTSQQMHLQHSSTTTNTAVPYEYNYAGILCAGATYTLLTEVCHNVSIEPHLQPITGETFPAMTANTEDGARSDIAADGFWGGRFERTFFDVRVFNPYAPSNQTPTPSSCYRKHERENTNFEFERLSELHSLQSSSLQQEAWVSLPLPPTNVWHHC